MSALEEQVKGKKVRKSVKISLDALPKEEPPKPVEPPKAPEPVKAAEPAKTTEVHHHHHYVREVVPLYQMVRGVGRRKRRVRRHKK